MQKSRIAVCGVGLGLLATLLVVGHQGRSRWRQENLALRQRLERLAQAGDETRARPVAPAPSEAALPEEQFRELLRLRGEIGLLRQQTNEVAKLRAENQQLRSTDNEAAKPAEYTPRGSWSYAGYAQPEAAFQSTLWAWANGDPKTVLASLHPADRAAMGKKSDQEVAAKFAQSKIKGFRILGRKQVSEDEMVLIVHCYPDHPEVANGELDFRRVGSEWRWYRGYELTGLTW